MPDSYSPREHLLRVYQRWWLIVLFGLLGGLFGWLAYTTREPIYTSSFAFAVTIDPAQTGPLAERDYDRLQHAFGRITNAPDIINAALAEAELEGIELDLDGFREIAVQEWLGSVWEYTVRHPDPNVARTLAELWGESGAAAVQTALVHAQAARQLQLYMDTLTTCGDPSLDPASGACILPPYEDIEMELESLTARWEEEVDLSRGLIPAVAYEQTRRAELPTQPVTSGRAAFIFLGALVGMLGGIWIANVDGLAGRQASP